MKLRSINSIDDIKDGDVVLLENKNGGISFHKDVKVKVTDKDGTEIILSRMTFFNLGMYLKGESWVKEILKVEL